MINSSVFTELYAPGLRKVIFESYQYMPAEYPRFIIEASSKQQYEEDYRMGGFGTVPTKPEGTAIIYDDPVPDTKVQFFWTPYGKGFRATHEAMVDELYGQMKKMAKALGKAFKNQVEIIAATLLDNAFTDPSAGDTNSGYDDLALCHASHPLVRGGTARNVPTAHVDLSVTALQDALVDFERFVDESGVPIVLVPRKLIYSPENDPLVQEILKSAQKPFTADNETNILQGALEPVMTHYQTDTDAWFLEADKSDLDIWLFWREKFSSAASDDFDTGDGKMKGYMRLATGFGDWRGIWGTSGSA
jgi:hypothetical protein